MSKLIGWIPVSERLPSKDDFGRTGFYLVTCYDDDLEQLTVKASAWGPVEDNDNLSDTCKKYTYDGWAFGIVDLFADEISYIDFAVAWAKMPDPYEEMTKSEDPWYYTLGARIAMRGMDGEWHNGVVCSGYRFKDGIVTMERDDGLGKLWCGEEGEKMWFRKPSESKEVDRERIPELISAREAYKISTQSNEERDKIIFEKVKETILEAIKKGYMYCEVEMLPASIVERLEELGYTVDLVKVKYHGVDPYCLISWPIDDDY